MMENRFEKPLEMAIRPSLLLKRYLQLLHALVALALFWPMEMSWMVRGVLLLLCLCSYFYYCRKCLLIPHVTALAWRRRGEWAVRDNAGEWFDSSLYGEVLLLNWIVIVQMKTAQGRKYPLLLLKDSMDEDQFRHLRIRVSCETA